MSKLEETLNGLAEIQTMPCLVQYMDELRCTYKLANIAFHLVSPPRAAARRPALMVTYDRPWVDRYIEQDYFQIDPIVLAGSSSFLPVDWDSVDRSSERTIRLFAEAESYGVGNRGLTVPIRGLGRDRSLVTMTAFETANDWTRRRLPLLRDMHIVAHFIHDRYLTLSDLRAAPIKPRLSRREIQCMEAIARGRAPKQIAYDLDLSISAVRLYIRSAKMKLGASNTYQAVARAVRDELVLA